MLTINAAAANSRIRISVIIPALNEAEMIGRSLDHLALSDFPPNAFEVIVVDNGSTDRTREIASSYVGRLNISVLLRPGINISALRNAGVSEAQGEILAFLDADCLVPADWLKNAEIHLSNENAGIVGGSISIPADSRWPAWAWYGVGYAPKDATVSYVPSGNMLMRRATFMRLQGFDENLKTSEDWDLCSRGRAAGISIRAVAAMAVVHLRTPQTLAEFCRRERWHGAHVAKMFQKNVRELSSLRTVMFAGYTLACSAAVMAGIAVAFLTRSYGLLAISLAALLAGALACTLRKVRSVHGRDFWLSLLPLTVLHIAYGLARAQALLNVGRNTATQKKVTSAVSGATA